MSSADEKVKRRERGFFQVTAEANQPEELSDKDRSRMRLMGEELASIYRQRVETYQEAYKAYPQDEWIQENYAPEKVHDLATQAPDEAKLQQLMRQRVERLNWSDLYDALQRSPDEALKLWVGVLIVAQREYEGGMFSAKSLYHTDSRMWDTAMFLAIRDSHMEAWKPRDAIEGGMVEMLVQAFISYHYWLRLANSMAAREYEAAENPQGLKKNKYGERPNWNPPRLDVADAIDRAMAMADRFNRLYLRTLRQMRDLRRYSIPVTINNPQQVNIAADGGQQVNVQKKSKQKKKQKRL